MSTEPNNPANMIDLDYRAEAQRLGRDDFGGPIIDVHTHIGTPAAAALYRTVADLYGIERMFSMTQLEQTEGVRKRLGDRIEFIAIPNYEARDEPDTFTTDWLRRIRAFRDTGARVVKFWAAPRGRDFIGDALALDSPIRREAMRLARDLGYSVFMTHVGDPDTWFRARYTDVEKYGTKRQQYEPFERALEEFSDVTWIAAHLGGYPEDLDFLQGLLDRHPHLFLDTSATKWMVRELSRHPRQRVRAFFDRNRGRVLFGSDVVADDKNLDFDLFASRYWSLRTLFETTHEGPSPIVDPDLHMVDPAVPEDATAPLRGAGLERATLEWIYRRSAERIFHGSAVPGFKGSEVEP